MLNGEMADLSVDGDGNLFINDARVTSADMVAGNGVIHAINKVLSLPGDASSVVADFSTGAFEGATVDTENEIYTFTGQDWAGFANNADIYPLSFEEGGTITFTASAATPTNVRFRFEYQPYPNVDPSYDTEYALIDSTEPKEYTIEIPSQAPTPSHRSLYVVERDQPVYVTNVVVTVCPLSQNPRRTVLRLLTSQRVRSRVPLLIPRTRSTPSQVKTGLAGRTMPTSTHSR